MCLFQMTLGVTGVINCVFFIVSFPGHRVSLCLFQVASLVNLISFSLDVIFYAPSVLLNLGQGQAAKLTLGGHLSYKTYMVVMIVIINIVLKIQSIVS